MSLSASRNRTRKREARSKHILGS